MIKLDKKPSEEVYEIVLYGAFSPRKFHPLWFAKNNLLGEKEASEAEVLAILEEDALFKTKFLRIHIQKDKFKISTEQQLSWDLVREMAVNITKILDQSLKDTYSIHVKLHYRLKSKGEFSKVLNSFNKNQDVWSNILRKPQLSHLSVEENYKTKYTVQ